MYQAAAIQLDGASYPYQLLLPPGAGERAPLVVFLHGAGERGRDNQRQLTWLPAVLAAQRRRYPCCVLALQCPEDEQWVEVPWDRTDSQPQPAAPSRALRAVMAALQRVFSEQPIDRARVYLTGLSMGGYGSWDLATRHPEWFAALLPVCGGGDATKAERLRGLPVFAFHGAEDPAVPVQQSRLMVEALRRLAIPVRYAELPGVQHDSWRQAYSEGGGLDWLFAQRRGGQ